MNIILVRTGGVDAPAGTVLGQSDPPLAAHGFTATQRLAASWSGPAPRFLFSSDLRRAAQCAQIFAAQFALEPLLDPRLRELDAGRWNGQTLQAIARDDRALHAAWRERWAMQPAPGGESFTDLLRRTGAWLAALLDAAPENTSVLALAHEGSIRALVCHALGLPPQQARRLRVDPAHVTSISHRAGRFEVSFVNASRFQDTARHD